MRAHSAAGPHENSLIFRVNKHKQENNPSSRRWVYASLLPPLRHSRGKKEHFKNNRTRTICNSRAGQRLGNEEKRKKTPQGRANLPREISPRR